MSDEPDLLSEDSGAGYQVRSAPLASPVSEMSNPEEGSKTAAQLSKPSVAVGFGDLFSENVAAKIWRVAMAYIEENVGTQQPVISVAADLLTISLAAGL